LRLLLKFALYAMATWRITQMLVSEAGPGRVFIKLREATGVQHSDDGTAVSWGDWTPLACTKCTSVYVATAMSIAPNWVHWLMAASAVSVLLDSYTERKNG
jgi:hypothetical protein